MKKRIISLLAALVLLGGGGLAEQASPGLAGASDMTDVIDIVEEGMSPVTADMLKDGVYAVSVDVSSSMFKVTGCEVTVADGAMTATLYMKSESYSHMYPGPAEDAVDAPESAWLPLETREDGSLSFTLPVDALNVAYTCAALSSRKQLWYPRTLVFRADSLPLAAWKDEYLVTVETLGLADGAYTCEAALTGAGRATLHSPVLLTVKDGACMAEIVFSTSKIDYVIMDGEKYEPLRTEGGAAFEVPVAAFGLSLPIVADSTAIKPAVEVQYAVTFDETTIASLREEE
ncbi:MAG: hypothetical protein J5998_05325 [Clostridia bacterium]|nr:hypothetical protein [Clostridia bacterium]